MSYALPPQVTRAGVPTVNDDIGAGFVIGSQIINTATTPRTVYICADNTLGAASWIAVPSSVGTPPITVVNTTPYAAAANTFLVVKPSVATIVVNLPAGVLDASIIIKHGNDSLFDVQVNANGAETIDGQGSYLLTTRQSITITFEGGVWHSR